jgi:hypothetical protein
VVAFLGAAVVIAGLKVAAGWLIGQRLRDMVSQRAAAAGFDFEVLGVALGWTGDLAVDALRLDAPVHPGGRLSDREFVHCPRVVVEPDWPKLLNGVRALRAVRLHGCSVQARLSRQLGTRFDHLRRGGGLAKSGAGAGGKVAVDEITLDRLHLAVTLDDSWPKPLRQASLGVRLDGKVDPTSPRHQLSIAQGHAPRGGTVAIAFARGQPVSVDVAAGPRSNGLTAWLQPDGVESASVTVLQAHADRTSAAIDGLAVTDPRATAAASQITLELEPKAVLRVRDGRVHTATDRLAVVDLAVSATSFDALRDPRQWQSLRAVGPSVAVRADSPLMQRFAVARELPQRLAQLRTGTADAPEPDDDADTPLHMPEPPPPTADQRRPAYRWMELLESAHDRALSLHALLEKAWPARHLARGLDLVVRDASLMLTDRAGAVLAGVRGATLKSNVATAAGQAPLELGGEPIDARGPWGRIGVRWLRDPRRRHTVDVAVHGAGVAQALAARIPGLALGDAAAVDATLRVQVPDPQAVTVAGRVYAERMGIRWWRLSDKPIDDFGIEAGVQAEITARPSRFSFHATDMRIWGTRAPTGAALHAELAVSDIGGSPRIHARLTAPMQDCGEMLHAIPQSLLPTLQRIDAHGLLSWHAALSVRLPQTGAVDVDLALGDTPCVVDRFGELDGDLRELAGDFVRPVNESGKRLPDVPIGPLSDSWTPLVAIPNWVSYGMWATEDPFLRHRGISEDLLEKALGIDFTTGRFTYGGSTITQQLAKNLYLRRTKALARKFEEMLIVWQLERVLGKRRILELYCNVVEFGPKVYGLTRAAWAFFSKRPSELTPEEGLYLAIIKPSPRSGYGTMRADGWGTWYEQKMRKYMDKFLAEGIITQAQYERAAARTFKPMFNPPRPGAR